MPWKMDNDKLVLIDGNPVFVTADGEEKAVDYDKMAQSLSAANRESAARRERIRELEKITSSLSGIDDVAAFVEEAKRNADAVAALSAKEKDAEAVNRARLQAATDPLNKRIEELQAAYKEAESRWQTSVLDGKFSSSAYVEKELLDANLARDLFRRFFRFGKDGELEAVDTAGNVIFGDDGKPADFDAAMRKLVASSPYKDCVLKHSRTTGSGTTPPFGNNTKQNASPQDNIRSGLGTFLRK